MGFTLQYEMSYTNILHMLALGGIPVRNEERAEADPIVLAGGPCAYNPEPLHAFVDAFLMGDGEESVVEVLRVIGEARKQGLARLEILRRLAQVDSVYVPRFYEASYDEKGRLSGLSATLPEAKLPITKRMVLDLDQAIYP